MTNPPPQRERARTVPQAQRRQVALPGAQQGQRRGGLLLLGLLLVFGAGFGFWFVLQSIDERAEYLIAARTIERWEVVRAQDFTLVEANVGTASALTVDQHRRGARQVGDRPDTRRDDRHRGPVRDAAPVGGGRGRPGAHPGEAAGRGKLPSAA